MPRMKHASIAFTLTLALAACGSGAKKAPEGPLADDVPQEVICCMWMSDDGTDERKVVPLAQCPEDKRDSVDACNVGPGDAEPSDD
jgi:hypothetical protein